MNGDYQSVATAPLDLRTTNRERGSSRARSPDCTGPVKDARGTSGSPAPPASTGTDSLQTSCPAVRDSLSLRNGAASKRQADDSFLRLPLRKRPYPAEPEPQSQSPAPLEIEDRFPSPLDRDFTSRVSRQERVADVCRIVGPLTPRWVGEARSPEGYHIRFLPQTDYGRRKLSYNSQLYKQARSY